MPCSRPIFQRRRRGWTILTISHLYSFIKSPISNNSQHKLADLSRKYIQPELDAGGGPGGAGRYKLEFELESLAAVHFSADKLADTPKGNRQFNYIFSLLAVFILIIALLNYINLSTAKSTERAREVGIRKVSGASRFQLMRQFLFESFFLLVIACLVAIGLVLLGLPFFNKLLETKLSLHWSERSAVYGDHIFSYPITGRIISGLCTIGFQAHQRAEGKLAS